MHLLALRFLRRTLLLLALAWCAISANAQSPASDPLKTDLMGVFAHPDDETGVASTLAYYALGQGKVVANVYCTRGEGGGNMVGTQSGAALGILREVELRACLEKLGIRFCYFLDRTDFAYTESLAITLERWKKEETLGGLVRLVRELRPEVIVTMNPAPTAGQHGNHQAAGLLATEAFRAAADPKRFPEHLSKEGLHVWQVRKLYYSGWDDPQQTLIASTNALSDGRFAWQAAGEALSQHRSQGFGRSQGTNNYASSPWMRRAQMFRLVKSVVPWVPEEDLFRGLPVTAARATPVRLAPVATPGLILEFAARPAIANYQRWVREQDLDGVARRIPADVSVVAGEPNEIKLTVSNSQSTEVSGEVELSPLPGWSFKPSSVGYRLQPGRSSVVSLRVIPPNDGLGLVALVAKTRVNNAEIIGNLRMNVVPHLRATHASEEPAMDGSDRGWETIPWQSISHTNVWEGKVRDALDSSATFRVATRNKTLFFDVLVNDDVVVTNIAPDDIKGHWRSDSIELCLDPQAGAENALGSYKLGIFPFDTTGVVKAARDADANPGPVAETAPKTRITSQRTGRGYRVWLSIPFSEIGIPYARRIGFNLLIYDGDKEKAALGENINKSRLAWSPRSGVQGRPEDWGRLDLD